MQLEHYSATVRRMNEDTVALLRADLLNQRGNYHRISRESGLSYSWLCKFAQGRRINPTITTITKLQAALALAADPYPAQSKEAANG